MRRREFITLLGSTAAAAWPLAARAQQGERMRRIGVLGIADDVEAQSWVSVLVRRLQELGWTDGRNVQWPRNTRYQADATPYLGRTSTG